MMARCYHLFVDGFGGMGDAVVCTKCGLDKYPEALSLSLPIYKLLGRVIKNDGSFVHHNEAPFVRKRIEQIESMKES